MDEAPRPLRVVVVDDEPLARASVRRLLEEDHDVEVVAECANGAEAVACVRRYAPDLLFLDVQMPGLGGFDVLAALDEEEWPLVVFATAYDHFALKAFDVHAVDYLLKPFDDERFFTALERAKERWREGERASEGLAELVERATSDELDPEPPRQLAVRRRLAIHREGRVDYVDAADVLWVEAADQYVRLHTRGGEELMRESMARLEEQLDQARFVRVHRSAIVAVDQVTSLESLGGGRARVVLAGGERLPVSRSRVALLRRLLG